MFGRVIALAASGLYARGRCMRWPYLAQEWRRGAVMQCASVLIFARSSALRGAHIIKALVTVSWRWMRSAAAWPGIAALTAPPVIADGALVQGAKNKGVAQRRKKIKKIFKRGLT